MAFHHQFSTIIRLESRHHRDLSEDIIGPARKRWVIRHLTEVAQAQGFTLQLSAQRSTLNVHAQEFITPSPAQTATSGRSGHVTPWYDDFYLADQGVFDSSGRQLPAASTIASHHLSRPPGPYHPFDPIELSAYRATVQAQLGHSSNQQAQSQRSASGSASGRHVDSHLDSLRCQSHSHPLSRPPTTPPNHFPRVRYPSTPPNRSVRRHHHHHRRQTSSLEDLSNLVANTTLRANTESIAQSKMGSLSAPDHYRPLEIYAVEIQIGDYIQSATNPGTQRRSIFFPVHSNSTLSTPTFVVSAMIFPTKNTTDSYFTSPLGEVMDHYPCSDLDHQPIGESEARPVSPNGGLCIQFKGADGTTSTKVFKGLDKVQVQREVLANDDEKVEVKKEV